MTPEERREVQRPAPPAGNERELYPAFDQHNPPAPELLSDCVHCGFCLPSCPTYALWGEEMDSPRGRILLMDLAQRRELPMTESMVSHWDSCLGCLACVPACPSGVAYDRLLESTRQQVERRYRRPWPQRLWREALFAVLPHPATMRAALAALWVTQQVGLDRLAERPGVAARLPAQLRSTVNLAPRVRLSALAAPLPRPRHSSSGGRPRMRVGLLAGCVQRVMEPQVNEATASVLAAYGAEVRVPPGQGCCGALELHSGREESALARARRLVRHFEDPELDCIAVNAAGCGAMLRSLGRLLAEDPQWAERAARVAAKVRDISEILDELGPPSNLNPLPLRTAYHDACHLAHGQGVKDAPRRMLEAIPALELLEIPESELCCGSAGTYNLTEPVAAHELGMRKAGNIRTVSPQCVAAGNPGCLLQIRAALRESGSPLPALHPVQLLSASLQGLSAEQALAAAG